MKVKGWLAILSMAMFLVCGCGPLGEDESSDSNNEGNGNVNGSGDHINENQNVQIDKLVMLSDPYQIDYFVSPYGATYEFQVAANNKNAIHFLVEDAEFAGEDFYSFEYTEVEGTSSGVFEYVYNVVLTFYPNDTGETRDRAFGKYVKGLMDFVQFAKLYIYEMPEEVLYAGARGASLNDFQVITSFYDDNYSDIYQEVYYTDNKEYLVGEPVFDENYKNWSGLVIAPNPTTEERVITINYGIKNINTGVISKVTSYNVVQSGEPYAVAPASIVVEKGGEVVKIKVESNVNIQVSENVDWIEYIGVENGIYSFKVSENKTGSLRCGDILFTNSNSGVSVCGSITQYGDDIRRIHLKAEDNLADVISIEEMVQLEAVAISGYMDYEDFTTMNTYMTVAEYIDLSGLEVDSYSGYVYLESHTFQNMTLLKQAILPENIRVIPYSCFADCVSLEKVTIPNGVQEIQSEAFDGCKSLKYIDIPVTVKEFGFAAFWGCESLESVVIPEGVTELACSMFFECTSLKNVSLPHSLESFKDIMTGGRNGSQFAFCSSLESINIPDKVTKLPIHSFCGCIKLKDINVDNIEVFGDAAFSGCKELKSLDFSSNLTHIGVTAFEDCSGLTTINLPIGLISLLDGAFMGCTGLTKVEIPATIKAISDRVFEGCTALSEVTLPKSITTIGASAFENCNLTQITLPANLRIIDGKAFNGNSISEIEIPKTVENIGIYAFNSNNIKVLNIPENVKEVGSYAFAYNGIEELTLNDGLQEIGNYAFYENDFEFLRIPESVTEIGSHAFAECQKMKTAIIKANITTLKPRTFFNCIDMVKLQLPKTLTTVEEQAFSACQQVRYIYSEAVVPPTGEGMRPLVWAFITVYVPSDLEEIYMTADSWFNDSYDVRSITEFVFDFSQLDFEL